MFFLLLFLIFAFLLNFSNKKAVLGIVGNGQKSPQVESVKIFGTRDMNMDPNAKSLFDEIDYSNFNFANKFTKPYFNDAQENFLH